MSYFSILIFDYCQSGPFNIFSFIATNIDCAAEEKHLSGKIEGLPISSNQTKAWSADFCFISWRVQSNFASHHSSIEACLGQYVGRTNAFFRLGGQKWVDWPFSRPEMGWLRNSGQTMPPDLELEWRSPNWGGPEKLTKYRYKYRYKHRYKYKYK